MLTLPSGALRRSSPSAALRLVHWAAAKLAAAAAWRYAPAVALPAILLLALAVHLATLRDGHIWGDDYALYLTHAKNLVAGRPYTDTGFIYNPDCASYSPRNYPPVYPLLLAPVGWATGFDFTAFKLLGTALFLGFVVACWFLFRPLLPFPLLLGLTAFLALHPFFAAFKENILSDLAFGLFAFLALLAYESTCRKEAVGRGRWYSGLALGLLMYLAYGTRSVGIVLVPCVLLAEVIRRRRWPAPAALWAVAVFAVLAGAQGLVLHGDRSYLDQLKENPLATASRQAGPYAKNVLEHFANGLPGFVGQPFKLAAAALTLVGFVVAARPRLTLFHIFAVVYAAAILIWTSYLGSRAMIPLLPLVFYWFVAGGRWLHSRLPQPVGWAAATALGLALAGGELAGYAKRETGPVANGPFTPAAKDCFAFIRERTAPDAVVVFSRCRALTYFAGRKAATYHTPADDRQLWNYFDQIGATHVVATVGLEPTFIRDSEYLIPFVRRHADRFELVHANEHFRVFRIRAEGPVGAAVAAATD